MDNVRGFGEDRLGMDALDDGPAGYGAESGGAETPIDVGTDERRMHVRAYNHWVSLLGGRAYPSIEDLDPANIADFGPHSVLLDFSQGIENPAIAYLGKALREECSLDSSVTHIAQVPSRSLLSRLTDHYLQIIANRSPIGFEAEFVGTRGFNTMYRGILMPFSSDDDSIDFIYGVINWKELVDPALQATLQAEIAAAVSSAPKIVPAAPVWADGPSAGLDADAEDDETLPEPIGASLPDRLMLAQQTAAAVRAADTRSRATLYRALGRAHDFAAAADADPVGYVALLDSAGIAVQLRAPMTPVVKLVFGTGYDKTRLTEYAAVLAHARRVGVADGQLGGFLEGFEGGIKGVVKAERAARAPVAKPRPDATIALADRARLGSVTIETGLAAGDYVVLLARVGTEGALDVVAAIGDDAALTERTKRRALSA
uniref:PAS domain-containing protein n=1 Tax=uncultured Sphingomonas sp. TaxID=158754 RepID=UPI0035CA0121